MRKYAKAPATPGLRSVYDAYGVTKKAARPVTPAQKPAAPASMGKAVGAHPLQQGASAAMKPTVPGIPGAGAQPPANNGPVFNPRVGGVNGVPSLAPFLTSLIQYTGAAGRGSSVGR